MSFDFELVSKRLRGSERRDLEEAWTGAAGPYGEVTLTVGRVSRRAELFCQALPEAWITHPDTFREGRIALDGRTRLVVGGQEAELRQNRRAISKEERALRIRLGERHYDYLSTGTHTEELRGAQHGPLVRFHRASHKKLEVTVRPEANALDLALGLILQGADMRNLTVTRAAVLGVLSFLDSREGET